MQSSLTTIVRIVASLAIVCVALLAILFVLDIVPREAFQDMSLKVLSVGGITLVSLIALTFILRK